MDLPKAFVKKNQTGKLGREPERESRHKPPAAMSQEALVINCSRCDFAPDPGTAECIRCMVSSMCAVGSTDRIVLRTGKDLEISGRSGKVIKDTASVMRWSFPQEEAKGRCKACDLSRKKVMARLWESFPENAVLTAEASLEGRRPQGKDCEMCVLRTRRALEQLDKGLREVCERMSDVSGGSLRCCAFRLGRG